MTISFIVPIYKEEKYIEKFLQYFVTNNRNDHEIIFVVSANKQNKSLNTIFGKKFAHLNIKVVCNSAHQKLSYALMHGVKIANGKYVSFCSVYDLLNDDYLKKIKKIIKENSPDLIEYSFTFKKIQFHINNSSKNQLIKISENNDVVAFSIPFVFNKIVKKNLFKNVDVHLFKDGNSWFDFSLFFSIITKAKTYYGCTKSLKTVRFIDKILINPSRIGKIITVVINNHKDKKLYNEVVYLSWNTIAIYQMGILFLTKQNNVIKHLYEDLPKIANLPYFHHALIHNKYFIPERIGTKILESIPSLKIYKKLLSEVK